MSVTAVREIMCEMPSADSTGERSYICTYQVETDDVNDGPITVRDTAGIPVVNSSFVWGNDYDNGAYATNYSAQRDPNSRKVWNVQVTFTTSPTRRNDDVFEDDPTQQAAIISGGGVRFSKVLDRDANGVAIVNSCDDLIPGIEADDDRPSLRIQKNFATIDLDQFAEFANSVNSATFFGLSARKWKLSHPRWEQRFRGSGTPFYAVTFEFEGNRDTWDVKPFDRGFFYLDDNFEKQRFTANGIILSSPQNLDGIGGKLAAGNPPVIADTFEPYPSKDFSLLGIPTTL